MLYQLSHSRVSEGKINVFIRKFQESIKLFFPSICELPPCPFSISSRTVFSRPSALPLHTPPFFLSTKEGTIAPQNENTEGFLTVAAAFPANISHDTQRKEDKRGEEATFYLILRTLGGVHGKAEETLQEDDYLFRQPNGDPMVPTTFTFRFKKILKQNGLPEDLNVHSLRHTNASLLIAQGVDVRTVASLLGHSQASTTLDIYAHAFDKKKREAQEMLGEVMGL